MPYSFVANSIHTKKLCSRLSSIEVKYYTENRRFAFPSPIGSLGVTCDGHLKLIGKCLVDFLLVIIMTLFRCYS